MNALPEELRLYRNELRSAIERDLEHRRVQKRQVAIPIVAVAGIAAAALVIVSTLGVQARSADAAILHRISAALAPRAGTLLHERALVSVPGRSSTYELWAQADSPFAYRVIKWGHETSWNGSRYSSYDAATNTITMGQSVATTGKSHEPDDVAATVRQLAQSGQAQVEATTLDGVPAYKLTVSGSSDRFLNGTVYVARDSYYPLLIQTSAGCFGTCTETIKYQTYEYLPASASNIRLLDLSAQHPGATVASAP
jgi:hypothetical protein